MGNTSLKNPPLPVGFAYLGKSRYRLPNRQVVQFNSPSVANLQLNRDLFRWDYKDDLKLSPHGEMGQLLKAYNAEIRRLIRIERSR